MATQFKCPDDPAVILKQKVCLNAISKDYKGSMKLLERAEEKCSTPECVTFKTIHTLVIKSVSHAPCESKIGKLLRGPLTVEKLVTVFDKDIKGRGFHAGDFVWEGAGFRASGRISGMTNVGTHRANVFTGCQKCHAPGFMEGRICGQIEAKMPELNGCQIFGVYRLKVNNLGGNSGLQGVIEGVVICPCK
jgi:hypothetical protein